MKLSEFMKNPFISSIKDKTNWTFSETGTKKPMDFNFILKCKENPSIQYYPLGASFANNNKPLVTLPEMAKVSDDFPNAAYFLSQLTDSFVVLDIEPSCPKDIKAELLHYPYDYVEISASGKGVHAIITDLNTKYPTIKQNAVKLQEEHKYYEFLLNHYVTFTGNLLIPFTDYAIKIEDYFDNLAKDATLSQSENIEIDQSKFNSIPHLEKILDSMSDVKYEKTPESFNYDMSRYEFGCAGFLLSRLLYRLDLYPDHKYTQEETALLLYKTLEDKIAHRAKHDTLRNGIPYLLYMTSRIVTRKDA